MNWNWFKKIAKEYPSYWLNYTDSFNTKNSTNRYVVLDCETTGLELKKDRILSIGAIAIEKQQIIVHDFLNIFLIQDIFKAETVPIHGILKNGSEEKVEEEKAIIMFLDYIQNATLVGHHVAFDIGMINKALERLDLPNLKNQYMDTDIMYQKWKYYPTEQHTSLDALCDVFKINKNDRHTASGDAFITALIFLKLKKKLAI